MKKTVNAAVNKKKKKLSLKWSLIGIILFCWVLPLATICGVMGYYITENINSQLLDTITSSAENSVKIAVNNLNSAITASRYASYDTRVRQAYEAYLDTDDSATRDMQLYSAVNTFLTQQYKYDEKSNLTLLYFKNSPKEIYYTTNSKDNGGYYSIYEYRNYVQKEVEKISKTLESGVEFLAVNGKIYMIRNLLSNDYRPYAVIVMELNQKYLFESFASVAWGMDTTIWLNSAQINYEGKPVTIDKSVIDLGEDEITLLEDNTLIYGEKSLDNYTFSYALKLNSFTLNEDLERFKFIMLGMGIFIIPLLIYVIRFFYNNVSRPIGRFSKAYRQLENGDLGVQVEENFSNSEFQYFTEAFNSMSQKMKNQFDRIYAEELALRDAKIMALQSQINPHFLNNTLEIINWEARIAGAGKVSQMIEALAVMLDAAMDRNGRPTIHISEEMMYVDAYLHIISERFGKRLVVVKDMNAMLMDCFIPRLVMQPIIENAVEHGIEPLQKGTIYIRSYLEGDNIVIEVENDGNLTADDEANIAAMLSDDFDASKMKSNSLGIRNVHQRLRIIYGESSGLSIKMNDFGRCVSKIFIPFNQSKQ